MTEMYRNVYTEPTFGEVFQLALTRRPDHIAMVYDGQRITYRELQKRINRSVRALQSLGLRHGDTVAHLSGNSPAPIVTWVSCAMLGLRYTPLHPMGTADADAFIFRKAKVRAVMADVTGYPERSRIALEGDNGVEFLLDISGAGAGTDFNLLCAAQDEGPAKVIARPEDVVAIFFTGGTTGEPKGVMHASRSLVACGTMGSDYDWPPDIQFYAATPISHALGYLVLPILLRGGTLHLRAGFTPRDFCDSVAAGTVNSAFMVPTMIYAVLDMPGVEKVDFSNLSTVFYGAAPITQQRLKDALSLFGPVLVQGYAQTEAPVTLVALNKDSHKGALLGSCGLPLVGNTVKILDEDCNELPAGEWGEVCIRGPLVMTGYLENPDETAKAFRGGWLHTGDIGYQNEDGYLFIVDRLKDMIISGGFNVYPKEVEDSIARHPAVSEVAVIGVPDAHWGEAVTAVVTLREGSSATAEEIMAIVKAEIGAVNAPKSVQFLDGLLPQTPLGKPDKKELRRMFAQPLT
jgi:fatty-acyl-CoA synthase